MVFPGALLELLVDATTVAAVARVRVAVVALLRLLVSHGPAAGSLGTTFFQGDLGDVKFMFTRNVIIPWWAAGRSQ